MRTNRTEEAERVGNTYRRRLEAEGSCGPVPALLWTPARISPPWPLVLLGHGGEGSKDAKRYQELARFFAERVRAAVLVIDGPAHGERAPRTGTPLDRFRETRRALADPETPGRMAGDWAAALVVARRVEGLDSGPVGYFGLSMGTLLGVPSVVELPEVHSAVFALGGVPRETGVAAVARAAGAPEAVVRIMLEEDAPAIRGRLLLEAAARLGGREILLLNMDADETFSMEGALRFFRAIPGPKRMAVWAGGHTDLPREALELAADFLRARLSGPSDLSSLFSTE
ncbi:MAG: alpha/beta hydrolase family protein [Myxococcota bacterium]